MTKPLNIGLIGYGFMGRAHSNAYRKVSHFFPSEYRPVLKAVCARDEGKAKEFAARWGYESVETDWRKLLQRDDIDAVDICTPNNLHHDIAIAAAKAGKLVMKSYEGDPKALMFFISYTKDGVDDIGSIDALQEELTQSDRYLEAEKS
jgi:siroheme synthase (precorrin-2 oxidase/ferrochelatase)